jgi:hypothetical protein
VSPFVGFSWPTPVNGDPGAWIETAGTLALCRNGIHACRSDALSRWLGEDLWRLELDEVELEREGVLLARRGRLLERIARWDDVVRPEFADWCLQRARKLAAAGPGPKVEAMLAYVEELTEASTVDVPMLAFCAAKIAGESDREGTPGERRRQSAWLIEHLQLEGARKPARSRWRWLRRSAG